MNKTDPKLATLPEVVWKNDKCFSIEDANFRLIQFGDRNRYSTEEELVVAKPNWLIYRYITLLNKLRPQHIVELGIKQGGSCAFIQKLATARKLLTIDLEEERVAALDHYIERSKLSDSLKPFYGINQTDRVQIDEIIQQEFGDSQLDLIIDDASHFLDETRQCFNILFPKLRENGAYVIEDWSWAHDTLDNEDDWPAFWPEREPLTKFVFELILACPTMPNLISEVVIDRNSATVWRGDAAIDEKHFDISTCSLARGRNLIA